MSAKRKHKPRPLPLPKRQRVQTLSEAVGELRDADRKRATVGQWKVRISGNHATFELAEAA